MARPKKCRCIRSKPNAIYFKPRGIPLMELEELTISLDEFEAVRLADYEGLYQEDGANRMKISRATFGRTLNDAHRKIAECLIKGKALRIEIDGQIKEEKS
jgi:predicted DNA-binding protein (UPF0251 family)